MIKIKSIIIIAMLKMIPRMTFYRKRIKYILVFAICVNRSFAEDAKSEYESFENNFQAVNGFNIISFNKDGKTSENIIIKSKQVRGNPLFGIFYHLENGNYLCTFRYNVIEMTPDGKNIFEYSSLDKGETASLGDRQISWCKRLKNGNTLIAESGKQEVIPSKNGKGKKKVVKELPHILEVSPSGKIVNRINLQLEGECKSSIYQMYGVLHLDNGHFIVAHIEKQMVNEYDGNGKLVKNIITFTEKLKKPVSLFYCSNGNILIGLSRSKPGFLEVTPTGEIIFELTYDDILDMELMCTIQIEKMKNGNYFVVNGLGHKKKDWNGYLFAEISPNKKIAKAFVNQKILPKTMYIKNLNKKRSSKK